MRRREDKSEMSGGGGGISGSGGGGGRMVSAAPPSKCCCCKTRDGVVIIGISILVSHFFLVFERKNYRKYSFTMFNVVELEYYKKKYNCSQAKNKKNGAIFFTWQADRYLKQHKLLMKQGKTDLLRFSWENEDFFIAVFHKIKRADICGLIWLTFKFSDST